MRHALPFVALALVVAAAAVAANLLLLRQATGGADPVGKLSPVAPGLAQTTTPQPPATTTADDGHDRGGRGEDD